MIYKITWSIVADGTLFKGAYAVIADDPEHAVERAKEALGPESRAASFAIKDQGAKVIELGRHEYPAEKMAVDKIPQVSPGMLSMKSDMYVFDVAARANVIASDEESCLKKLAHALLGKDVPAVKYLRTKASDPEPTGDLSTYEMHLLEKQFRSIRVAST